MNQGIGSVQNCFARTTRNALVALGLALGAAAAQADSVQYSYDDLGRLTQAADSTTQQAVSYSYDRVGNITSVGTSALSALTVASFAPATGAAGTLVTISGTGFSTTPSSNSVAFTGGAKGVVQSSPAPTATQMVVAVPAAATTGPITVTVGGKPVTSSMIFTVAAAAAAPSISSISPTSGSAGTAVQINGSNFSTVAGNNRVAFNNGFAAVSSASASSLTVTVPVSATSGPIQVATPAGTATSSQIFAVPPNFPSGSGLQNYPLTGGASGITVGSSSGVTESYSASTYSLMTFSGAAGQYLAIGATSVTGGGCNVLVVAPNGNPLILNASGSGAALYTASITASGQGIQLPPLPLTGTYSILVSASTSQAGSAQFKVAGPTPGTAIKSGSKPTTITLSIPGQRGMVTFATTAANTYAKLTATASTISSAKLSIIGPDGNSVISKVFGTGTGTVATLQPLLTLPGQYTVLVDPVGALSGAVSVGLITGTSFNLTTTTPATINYTSTYTGTTLTFADTAGDFPAITFSGNVAATATLSGPDGTPLVSNFAIPVGSVVMNPLNPASMPLNGAYTLQVNEVTPGTGTLGVTLATAAVDPLVMNTKANGSTSITSQWLNASLTGTQGQFLALDYHAANAGVYKIVDPNGSLLASGATGAGDTIINIMPNGSSPSPIAETGTYTLLFQQTGAKGDVTLEPSSEAVSSPGYITINGASLGEQTSHPGQWMKVSFSNNVTESLTLTVSAAPSGPAGTIWVLDPNGGVVKSGSIMGGGRATISLPNLPSNTTAQYTIVGQPSGQGMGLWTFGLTQP